MTQPLPLVSLHQSFLRAYTTRLHPELELLWHLDDVLRGRPLPSCSAAMTELTILNEAIETDATCVLLLPDFHRFFHTCLRNFHPPASAAVPPTPLSVDPAPECWQLHEFDGAIELAEFGGTPEARVDGRGKACRVYCYRFSMRLGEFVAEVEDIEMGRLYDAPFRFVVQEFKYQQEAILQQLERQLFEQGEILPAVVVETSCILCYVALAFVLEMRMEVFWAHKDAPLQQLLTAVHWQEA